MPEPMREQREGINAEMLRDPRWRDLRLRAQRMNLRMIAKMTRHLLWKRELIADLAPDDRTALVDDQRQLASEFHKLADHLATPPTPPEPVRQPPRVAPRQR